MTLKVIEYELPACWGSALVNSDCSGLDDSEIKEINAWEEKEQPGYCVDMSEESWFSNFTNNGKTIGAEVATFTFMCETDK